MDIFGKKTIAQLESRISAYQEELSKEKASVERLKAKLRQEATLREELLQQKRQIEEALLRTEAEKEKMAQKLQDAEKMVKWMEEKLACAGKENLELKQANETLTQKVTELSTEIETLRASLKDEAKKREKQDDLSEKVRRLEEENTALRKALIQKEEKLKIALRKAEHNRRAYLVTLMQLDLAEDKIYMLLHGKPRPVLRRHQDTGGECAPVVAEEVESEEQNEGEERTDQ